MVIPYIGNEEIISLKHIWTPVRSKTKAMSFTKFYSAEEKEKKFLKFHNFEKKNFHTNHQKPHLR